MHSGGHLGEPPFFLDAMGRWRGLRAIALPVRRTVFGVFLRGTAGDSRKKSLRNFKKNKGRPSYPHYV